MKAFLNKTVSHALILGLFLLSTAAQAAPRKTSRGASRPDHLIVMVFDQMRPDYINRFNLQNFKKLRAGGLNYPNAYVGHLGAETVVSHFVIASGLLPKEMPWQDEIYEDKKNLLGSGESSFFSTGSLSLEQLMTLMRQVDKTKLLQSKIKTKFNEAKVFTIGQKNYAATVFGTPESDSIITFKKADGVCTPVGVNVPAYISTNDRFTVECRNDFGTQGSLYPLDGARSVPGDDADHKGGDVWVADVAREVMDQEAHWHGMFLTFAGIDKVGHLTGDIDTLLPHSFDSKYKFEDALRIADAQLGRVLEKLEQKGLTEKTLIVITADHGAQTNMVYLGNGQKAYGQELANGKGSPQPYFIQRLLNTGRVKVNYQDTSIRLWLNPSKPEGDKAAVTDDQLVRMLSETSGLTEIYRLAEANGRYSYTRVFQNLTEQPKTYQAWAKAHHQELVNSMAAPGAPDLLGLMANGFGFDLPGDHGGAQEKVQRIPVMFKGPGVKAGSSAQQIKLVDLNGKISGLMGL